MNAPTFTAGPWRRAGHRSIAAGTGPDTVTICEVFSGGVGIEQADGNEALIATAPELHAVLLAVHTAVQAGKASVPPRVMASLSEALAKVSGRAAA